MSNECKNTQLELTGDKNLLSESAKVHIASCNKCQQTATALNALISSRSPLSTQELSSISKIIASTTSASVVSKPSALKSIIVKLFTGMCLIGVLLLVNTQVKDNSEIMPEQESQIESSSQTQNILAENDEKQGDESSNVSTENKTFIEDIQYDTIESQTAEDSNTKVVSPHEEDISPESN